MAISQSHFFSPSYFPLWIQNDIESKVRNSFVKAIKQIAKRN